MNRVIPGVLMAVGWVLLLFWGSAALFWGVGVCGAGIALHEYFRMTCPTLTGPRLATTLLLSLLPVLAALSGSGEAVLAALVASLMAIVAMALHGYTVIPDVFRYLCVSGFASLYIAVCLAHVVLIRFLPQGPFWLILLIAIVAGSDTGAYYAGKTFGKRKLFPQISPKKTIAGGVGGLVFGIAAAEGINLLFPEKTDRKSVV